MEWDKMRSAVGTRFAVVNAIWPCRLRALRRDAILPFAVQRVFGVQSPCLATGFYRNGPTAAYPNRQLRSGHAHALS
jgi:hypothetical protein